MEILTLFIWKDEAFLLWREWQRMYDEGTEAFNFLGSFASSCYLMTIVDNDFIRGNIFSLFKDQ